MGGGSQGGEMTQTMYAHVNKRTKKISLHANVRILEVKTYCTTPNILWATVWDME
jgi:hypothetical protein